MTDDPSFSFFSRLWFGWVCLFRVLVDGPFAARVWRIRQGPQLLAASPPATGWAEDAPSPPGTPPVMPTVTPTTAPTTAALQLLSMLQREGRLVDFLEQDIAAFSDADVGAAARVVHEGCRKALHAHAQIEPVFADDEGARVRLAAGFDADEVKLVGDVRGEPPYTGVLRHRGWRATRLELPQIVGGHDAHILAPAEVELG